MLEQAPIGHVVGTEQEPNTAYAFRFWANKDAPLGIGSMVRADADGIRVYGVVVQAYAYNDVPGALADYLGREGSPAKRPLTERPEVRLFEAAVLRREPEEPVGAVGIGPVFEATKEDVNAALGAAKFEGRGIPIGVYGPKERPVPILADPDFLLGPEAGHLNVTGTSGLAAKTSYIQFLLTSIFQKYPGEGENGVAAVMFNVKGGDLLFVDKQPLQPLPEDSKRIYEVCGIEPRPFEKVEYYAPFADETRATLRTLRNNPKLADNPTRGFCYGLKEALTHAEVLLNREDLDVKADAFLSYLVQEVAGRSVRLRGPTGAEDMVETLNDLVGVVKTMLAIAEEEGEKGYRSHHSSTIRKMLNRLNNFSVRFPGLISAAGKAQPALPDRFVDRTLYVIDVADLEPSAQDLVFAAVIGELRDRMERKDLGVSRLIVVVDELNKFAPSGGRETYVLSSLRDIAARGRYLGLVLFGAQQFRSRVDTQVIGNCANSAYGHIQLEELTNPIYTVYPEAVREKLATADPGEMMVRHPHFSQPVFIRFPMPPLLKGSDGMEQYKSVASITIEERIRRRAIELDSSLTPGEVNELLSRIPSGERDEGLIRIERELSKPGANPRDVLRLLGKKAPVSVGSQSDGPVYDPEDPFAEP